MRRVDRLKQLVERRRQGAVCIVEWPLWTLNTDRLITKLKDGEAARVALGWAPVTVWVARSGDQLLAAAPIGQASPEEIVAWFSTRFAEIAEQRKHPKPAPQPNPVDDIWQP